MSSGPRYRVSFRRKREGKTDYRSRTKLLLSRKPRLVTRTTLKRVITQITNYSEKGDVVLVACDSNGLKDYGWNGGTANLPAAYLTGLLCGRLAKEKGIASCVLDVGLAKPIAGSKLFAVVKGALDGGLKIPHNPDLLPKDERLKGAHIANYASLLKDDEKQKRFSEYLKRNLDPKDLPKHFDEVKDKILSGEGVKTEKVIKTRGKKKREPT